MVIGNFLITEILKNDTHVIWIVFDGVLRSYSLEKGCNQNDACNCANDVCVYGKVLIFKRSIISACILKIFSHLRKRKVCELSLQSRQSWTTYSRQTKITYKDGFKKCRVYNRRVHTLVFFFKCLSMF